MTDSPGGRRDWADTDAEIAFKAVQDGDFGRLRQVLAHFSPLIESVAASYARDQSDRDDLFQEICVRMWERRMQYTGSGPLRGWINKLARRVCSNWSRDRKTRRRSEARYVSEVAYMNGTHEAADPHKNVERSEFVARLRQCLSRLPKRQGDTFLMVYFEEYTTAEVAKSQGVRQETVRSNLRHAKKRLRILMKEYRE